MAVDTKNTTRDRAAIPVGFQPLIVSNRPANWESLREISFAESSIFGNKYELRK
jgi:hypothetical protein